MKKYTLSAWKNHLIHRRYFIPIRPVMEHNKKTRRDNLRVFNVGEMTYYFIKTIFLLIEFDPVVIV